ncbi:MAG: thiamine pyrophosphate-dependent dehydrogenase E1 component subunit alpha [Candidatus Tectomicrobia bacterium]|uniref:Thiamine pyrophosphate-dependent dehydrogenase E1 component subunit alpha n=1 Tax=Tectimicrobiota bacterium TaxID=2528274 RepID=A0A932M1T1_UNCTE|nr:thiamine pyrophosphate-dependent dehydrogenase E1 component subunit alpha [Candidatus Tectomicrobia bacterium]
MLRPVAKGVKAMEKATLLSLYRTMRLIRRFEERIVELINRNEIPGVTHEYVGEEAVATGVCSVLRPDDVITSTHRGHGHILAKGGQPRRMIAELMGRESGYNRGRGGSMHIADLSLGIYGANGIVGAGAPIACGAAFAAKLNGKDRVAVAFFGDGATNQGVVHEAMNLAAIWSLPVIFVCENNGYAISASIKEMATIERLSDRARGYGMPGEWVDGMDVLAVRGAAEKAVAHARRGEGPTFLECRTYRFVGHFTAERALNIRYRGDEEIAEWRKRDPVETFPAWLEREGIATAAETEGVRREVEGALEDAIAFARASPFPQGEEALDGMYATSYPNLPARGV